MTVTSAEMQRCGGYGCCSRMDPIRRSFCTHADYKRWIVEEERKNEDEMEKEKMTGRRKSMGEQEDEEETRGGE